MRVLDRLLYTIWKWSDSAQGADAMILEAALSEKKEENTWLPLLKCCYVLVCGIVKEGIAVVKYAAY